MLFLRNMHKIIIILSAVLLTWKVGAAQTVTSISIKDKQDTLQLTINDTERLIADVKVSNHANKNVHWSSSDSMIVEVDNQGNLTAKQIGTATIFIISDIDTTQRDSVVVEVDYSLAHYKEQFFILNDSISKLQSQISSSNNEESDLIPDLVSYALAVIVLTLLVLLFVMIRKKNAKITHNKTRKEHYEKEFNKNEKEKSVLLGEKNKLSLENEKLRDEIQNLRVEVEQKTRPLSPVPAPSLLQSLYADAIIDGKFNRVKEQPDDDTIFELKLRKPNAMRANVIVYAPSHKRVIANHSFLEGCEKQILGNTTVTMLREGIAQKDGSGKWFIIITPEIKIN